MEFVKHGFGSGLELGFGGGLLLGGKGLDVLEESLHPGVEFAILEREMKDVKRFRPVVDGETKSFVVARDTDRLDAIELLVLWKLLSQRGGDIGGRDRVPSEFSEMDPGKNVARLKPQIGFEADRGPQATQEDRPIITVPRLHDESVESGFKPLTRGITNVPDLLLRLFIDAFGGELHMEEIGRDLTMQTMRNILSLKQGVETTNDNILRKSKFPR
jgi:hypothetical protein